MKRIVITDCDYETIAPELQVAEEAGVELVRAYCTDEDQVIAAGQRADGLVVQYAPITARVLDALPGLKVISRYGVGVDTIDVNAAAERGITVCNVPDYGVEEVSDHAIALALTVLRGISELDRRMRTGHSDISAVKPLHRIRGRVFGCVGLGRIGAATARKALGLGFTVVAHDPVLTSADALEGLSAVKLVSLDDLLAQADVVSLHLPLTPQTRRLFNAERFGAMKSNAVLINTCRGGVVDTAALVQALNDGLIRGAGLDVFEEEPLPKDHPLFDLPNVVVTPHAAWYSEESFEELKRRTVMNAVDACLGRRPENVLV